MDWDSWSRAHYTREQKIEELRRLAKYLAGKTLFIADDVDADFAVNKLGYKSFNTFKSAAWLYVKHGGGGFVVHGLPNGVNSTYTWAPGFLVWLFPDGFPWEMSAQDTDETVVSPETSTSDTVSDGAAHVAAQLDTADVDDDAPAIVLVRELQQRLSDHVGTLVTLGKQCRAVSTQADVVSRSHAQAQQSLQEMMERIRSLQQQVNELGRDMEVLCDAQITLDADRVRLEAEQKRFETDLEEALRRAQLYSEARRRFLALTPEDRAYVQAMYASSDVASAA